ncbi:MAG: hypothetical protein U0798_01215 [Gemmataceae bacterium]
MIVLDANILLRRLCPADLHYHSVVEALDYFEQISEPFCLFPQTVYEFWAVATRPITANGLGMSAIDCQRHIQRLKRLYNLLNDQPSLLAEWESLVVTFACHGRISFDARIVAAMKTYGLTKLLTINASDFSRFAGLTVIDPTNFSQTKTS